MSRWIDADALMETLGIKSECVCCEYADEIFYCKQGSAFVDACEAINDAPSIDIVRCKECKYYDKFPTWSACTYWSGDPYEQASVNADDFCSYGERAEQTEPQTCEKCEHWNDTEDGCADRHGCTIDCAWK